jgi:phosphate-selective porin OprO/OprP
MALAAVMAFGSSAVVSQDDDGGNVETRLSAVEMAVQNSGINAPWTLIPTFKNGISIKSNNGQAIFKLGGRIQADTAFFANDGDNETIYGDQQDGFEFRRARINMEGRFWEQFFWRMQYDFAGGATTRPAFKDVYGGVSGLGCIGTVRAGHFKEPFGLEELTSSKYITFMERSGTSVFTPSRNAGIMMNNTLCDGRGTWAFGMFRNTMDDNASGSGDGDYSATGRVTHTPIFKNKGEQVVHLGLAASFQGAPGNTQRYRQRPPAHLSGRLIDLGGLMINHDQRLGGEIATVCGPLSFQGEVMSMWANGYRGQNDICGFAAYVMMSYFFTEEIRPYDSKSGTFKRITPKNSFLGGAGCGAWEGAIRYGYTDLDTDNQIPITANPSSMHDVTAGVNWYWNAVFRMMFNYVWAHPEGGGNLHIAEMRFQVAM